MIPRARIATRLTLSLLALLAAPSALCQLRVVPEQPVSASAARSGVDVFLINDGTAAVAAHAPERIEVIALDGARLALVPVERAPPSIAPQAFARVRYLSAGAIAVGPPPAPAAARPVPGTEIVAPPPPPRELPPPAPIATTDVPPSNAEPAPLPPPPGPAPEPPGETAVQTGNGSVASFADRFLSNEPIYGVIGAGESASKLQFSFAFRPFGGTDALSHLRFGYTQTMFWATDRPSGPFRATTYSPSVYLDLPVADSVRFAVGYAHDSNGEGERTSIDVNRLFVRAARSFDLGDRWHAEIAPQAWVYVGARGQSGGVQGYWGYTSVKASIGQDDGVKLALFARGNPGTGRGAAELFVSYPLTRLGGLGIYAFGQGFTGYGEALDDFRVRDTHARLGIALTR